MANKPLTPEETLIKDFEEHGCTDVSIEGYHFIGVPYKKIFFTVPDVGRFSYDISAASLRRYCKIAHVVLRELGLL